MIVHENEVSVWRDEREDTLRLPALKPHAWVETHVIEKTRILLSNTMARGFFFFNLDRHTGRPEKQKKMVLRTE